MSPPLPDALPGSPIASPTSTSTKMKEMIPPNDNGDDEYHSDHDDYHPLPSMLEPYQALLQCPSCHLLLDQPSTLHCGHTVCAQHLHHAPGSSATPAPVCPLPDCPSRTGNRTTSLPPLNIPASSRVAYFPAPHADAQPAPEPRATTEPRIDVAINKLLHLVGRAQEWEAAERAHGGFVPGQRAHDDSDTDDDDGDSAPGSTAPAAEPAAAASPRPPSPQQQQPGARPRPSSGSETSANHRPRKRRRGSQDGPAASSSSGAHRPSGGGGEASSARARFEKELRSEVTCEICFTLLHEPITTPCQHTYCGKCLQRSLDHSTACPLCREDLPGYAYFQAHPVARTLLAVLLHAFAPEYTARAEAIAQEERDARLDTPIFVCQLSFPGVPTLLHFFEPRYRLMLRRCLESAHPAFGMVMPPNAPAPGAAGGGGGGGGGNEYGTMLEIRSVQMLPDGRSMVETWGTHRFRILERGSLDGYMVGRIERVDDYATELDEGALAAEGSAIIDGAAPVRVAGQSPPPREARSALARLLSPSPEPEAPPTASGSASASSSASTSSASPPHPGPPTTPTNEQLMSTCRAFLLRLQEGTAPWVVQRLNNTYGPMPTDAASFSFWVALVLPIDEHEKAKLLPIKSARLRLRLVVHWIEQLNSNWWFSSGCVIL